MLRLGIGYNVSSRLSVADENLVNAAMRDAIAESVRFFDMQYKRTINRKTSRTASTIGSTVLGGGSRVSGRIGSSDKVARFLEEGTPPHIIRARSKKALFWPGARHPVRSVRHPGTRAYRPLLRASRSSGPHAKARLRGIYPRVFGI